MTHNLYATRPAPPTPPKTSGRVVITKPGGHTEHLFMGAYQHITLAVDALLYAHEKEKSFHDDRGWYAPVTGLGHELWDRGPDGQPRGPVARVNHDTFTVTSTFVSCLPGQDADACITAFAEFYQLIAEGKLPTRTPRLTVVIAPGTHLARAERDIA